MWTPGRSTSSPQSYQATSQLAVLPRILAYASGLTTDFPIDGYPHCTNARPKPSLKIRILCLASIFGIVGSTISQPISASSYFTTEVPIAKAGLLANIGPNGSKSSGANSGIVIASPSTVDPNYLYTWVRDSSLVFKAIADQFTLGYDTSLRGQIDNFFNAEASLQYVCSLSGSVSTGGLGEPKFNINGTAYPFSWGRPQRDGPALRSTALITYANWLLVNGNYSFVKDTMWPVIQRDLDYVATGWNQSTFDLWEEVYSSSFFTTAVQHRALREGSTLAAQLNQGSSVNTYNTQAANILCFLQTYWNPTGGYITANTGGCRSGKDSNTVLASIHTWDINAGCDATTFQPCSDKALSNLKVYVDSFRPIYPINSGINATSAVAVGRYPEDVYFHGNPWYLSTFAVAEQLYDALLTWNSTSSISVTSISLNFFRQFVPSITPGTYPSNTNEYSQLTSAVKTFADGFVQIAAQYTPSDGGLAEQFSKSTGLPLSAADLTWSYASVLTAASASVGGNNASWGAQGLTVPTICVPNPGAQVFVTFNVNATTQFGESIFLAGSIDALKDWSPDNALLLSSANYPIWSITVSLPANTDIQYKYIRKLNGNVKWESDPNNLFSTPSRGDISLADTWR